MTCEDDKGGRVREALRLALLCTEADERVSAPELAAMREVARAHGGAPFTLDPCCIGLVRVVLEARLGLWAQGGGDALVRQVAETLFEDPAFHARLQSLWTRLCEEAP